MDEEADSLSGGAQPHCAECGVLMRNHPDGYACPACGLHEFIADVKHPGDGSGLLEFRRRR